MIQRLANRDRCIIFLQNILLYHIKYNMSSQHLKKRINKAFFTRLYFGILPHQTVFYLKSTSEKSKKSYLL